jgi:hypothetical protein
MNRLNTSAYLKFVLKRLLYSDAELFNYLTFSTAFILKAYAHALSLKSIIRVHNLLSETLGTRHVSEIGIFRISEW